MREIKIYKNYGVLGAEKRNVYTYSGGHAQATGSDEMTVLVPDEWELYENLKEEYNVKSPWGWCYEINEVLADIDGRPAFRAIDKSGEPHVSYLYTVQENERRMNNEDN